MRKCPAHIIVFRTLLLALLMLCAAGFPVKAQSSKDTAEINRLLGQANKILNPDAAIARFDSILILSTKAKYADGAFYALITKGIKYFEKQDFDNYRKTTYEALPWAEKSSKPDNVAWCLINIGESWFCEGDYIKANLFYYKGLTDLNKRTKEITHTTANIYNCLGLVNMRLNQYDKALAFYNMAEAASKTANLGYQLAMSYENKGVYYLALNQPDSAEKYFRLEMGIGQKTGKVDLRAFAYAQLGKTYVSKGNYEKAVRALDSAMLLGRNRFTPPVVDAAYSLGDALRLMGKYRDAEAMLLWAYGETKRHNCKDYYIGGYTKLAALYRAMGNEQKALLYMDTLLLVKDSLTSADKAKAINHLEIKYKSSDKDRQLAENDLLIEKQEYKLAINNIFIFSIMSGILLLAILLFVTYRNTRHRQRLQEGQMKTMAQESTINILNAKVEGEEKERIRLARELHDGIGGMVSAAMMRFSTIPRYAPSITSEPAYTDAMSLLGEIGDEVRKTAHNLMPELLKKQSLPDAVHALCNSVQVDGVLKIDYQSYGDFSEVNQDSKLNIYRIVQELLKNVVKHANATNVLVQLMKHEGSMTITVEDDGTGFDTASANEGMGLQNLQARVKNLGGYYTLESAPGKGTTVYIEFESATDS